MYVLSKNRLLQYYRHTLILFTCIDVYIDYINPKVVNYIKEVLEVHTCNSTHFAIKLANRSAQLSGQLNR